jgi:FtsZ-binding cell division protein ZapB
MTTVQQLESKNGSLEGHVSNLQMTNERLNSENESNFKDSENYRTRLMGAENNMKVIPSLEAQVKILFLGVPYGKIRSKIWWRRKISSKTN